MAHSKEEWDRAREGLHAHLQEYLDTFENGNVLTKCFLVFEVVEPGNDYRTLSYRSLDLRGEFLPSWDALGLLTSALHATEEQGKGGMYSVGDDEGDGDGD